MQLSLHQFGLDEVLLAYVHAPVSSTWYRGRYGYINHTGTHCLQLCAQASVWTRIGNEGFRVGKLPSQTKNRVVERNISIS